MLLRYYWGTSKIVVLSFFFFAVSLLFFAGRWPMSILQQFIWYLSIRERSWWIPNRINGIHSIFSILQTHRTGPQDSGKTKLISAILASIGHTLRCVVYAPSASDIVGILNETKNLNMSHDQYKQFSEKAIVFERTCDLGADFGHMSAEKAKLI